MANRKRGISLIFHDKKGISHDLFFNVFELILAAIVILSLLNFVSDVAEQTIFKKNYLARDISLLVNTLYAAPVQVEYTYDEDLSDLVFEFSESRLSLYQEGGGEGVKIFYLFGEDKNVPFPVPDPNQYPILTYGEEATRMKFIKSPLGMEIDKVD